VRWTVLQQEVLNKQNSSFHFQLFILSPAFFLESCFLRVPYVQVLPEGLKDQTQITISGEPKPNAEKFAIDICKGDNIAFHFNPRFNEDGNQVIVRTTRIEGVWGPEERELPFFPFSPGKPFEILCTSSGYRVEVNNEYLLHYSHRIKELHQITHIQIRQNVVLKHVHIGM
uniref:Galectin n=1 Tax=Pygocentrus nattereri TaxID=42514 RepID=A0A3B4E085_PYGNA